MFLTKLAGSLGTYSVPEQASDAMRKFGIAAEAYDVKTLHAIRGIDGRLVEEAAAVAEIAIARHIA